jgi:glycine/D-amino acid oxidase-like deaminating enzyme
MTVSYWDQQELLQKIDYVVIGSGITGLSTAIHLKQAQPHKKVVVLERGMLPWGASTRNAGFACFGSMGELVMDLKNHTEAEVVQLLQMRSDGLTLLKELVGSQLQLESCGNYEVFRHSEKEEFEKLGAAIPKVNKLLRAVFKEDVFSVAPNCFGFKKVEGLIFNSYEGMLNTGKMMSALLALAKNLGVLIYNGARVASHVEAAEALQLRLSNGLELSAEKMLVCTNAFSGNLLKETEITPARNQVLITKPISNLPFSGAFHAQNGHLYFRTVGQRVLIGGGRQHFKAENNTTQLEISDEVQGYLEKQLREWIIPKQAFKVDQRWAGIIGVGAKKSPIIKKVSNRVYAGVRLGGMGVALGSLVGKKLSALAVKD